MVGVVVAVLSARTFVSAHYSVVSSAFEHKMFLMSQPLGCLRLFAKKYLTVITLKLSQKWLVESM